MTSSTIKKYLIPKKCFGINWQTAAIKTIKDVNVSAGDRYGRTPLHYAANWSENVKVINALIAKGADPKNRDDDGYIPLHMSAVRNKNEEVTKALIKALIKVGANVNVKSESCDTPLHMAAFNENHKIAESLISHGADVNAKDKEGATPLHDATHKRNFDVAKSLLKNGAHLNATDNKGRTPLHITFIEIFSAKTSSSAIKISSIKKHPISKKCFGINWQTATIKTIKDVNVSAGDRYGRTPLHYAANWSENVKVINALIAKGADPKSKDNEGYISLHMSAVRNKNEKVTKALIKALIKVGADVNVKSESCDTPLHMAAFNENHKIAESLISHGADVNAKDKEGATPLHDAAHTKNFDVTKSLLKNGAHLNATDNKGRTPLYIAVISYAQDNGKTTKDVSKVKKITEMLDHSGTNAKEKNESGKSALLAALKDPKFQIQVAVQILLAIILMP